MRGVFEPKYGKVDEVDDYLAGELSVWEVRYEGAATFFDQADVAFNFADVLACCCSVDLHHFTGVLNFVEFLIYHDNSDAETGLGV